MPAFTIITITKNNADGFARTRTSVAAQTFKDYEWIVIDGDAEPDAGIYDAMNKGITRAQGAYIIFMNAGDVFAAPDVLENVSAHLGPDFLYGDALEGGHYKPAHHTVTYGMPTHHQAMFFRRGDLRFDTRYKIAADYKFVLETIIKTMNVIPAEAGIQSAFHHKLDSGFRRNDSVKYLAFAICDFEPGGVSQQKTALGRREQSAIRRELNINAFGIHLLQGAALFLKNTMPKFYWYLRNKAKTSRA